NTIPFETMRMLLGEATSIDLELLPDSSDLIPEHITEFLPFTLPISDPHTFMTTKNPTSRPKKKGPTSTYPTRTITEPTPAFPTGPDALSPGFLGHDTTTKPDLSPKLKELTFYVKDNIPDIAAQVLITDYDTASQTIRAIQDHFNFTLILNYLIDLPDLSMPE
ncbi:21555_t:CDS:2, partial [Gigaspora margarita]